MKLNKNKPQELTEAVKDIKINDEAYVEIPILSAVALKSIERNKDIARINLEETEKVIDEFVKEQEKKVEDSKKNSIKPLDEAYLNENFKDLWTLNEDVYTVKCKGRKELRQLVAEAKENGIKYNFIRLDKIPERMNEGYKYDFTYSISKGLQKIEEEIEQPVETLVETTQEEPKEEVKESFASENVMEDLLDRARMIISDTGNWEEAVAQAIDEGLVYSRDIWNIAEDYVDDSTLLGLFYEDLYNDLYSKLADLGRDAEEDEIEEKLNVEEEHKEEEVKESLEESLLDESLNVIGNLNDYAPSKEAKELWDEIVANDLIREFENTVSDLYPDGASIEELNNLLGFHPEFVRGMLNLEQKEDAEIPEEDETMLDDETIDRVANQEQEFIPETNDEIEMSDVEENRTKYLNDETGYSDDDLSMLDELVNEEE